MNKSVPPSLENMTPWQVVGLMGGLGFSIAVPLVILVLIGRWLDRRYETEPWFLIAGLLVSLLVTSVIFLQKIKFYLQSTEKTKSPK